MAHPAAPPAGPSLVRALGVRALAANVVNNIVGSGIFVLPAAVAAILGPAAAVAYVLCAVMIGLVGLCFAEVGSRVQAAGGPYAYVEAAFGPYVGFLAGLLFWFGSIVASCAAVATVFAASLGALLPAVGGPVAQAALLVALFTVLAAVNVRGVRAGARLMELLTAAKLAPLVLLVLVGLFALRPAHLAWTGMPVLADVGRAALVLIFAFTGVEGALTSSGEVREPARTVPRAVFLGLAAVAERVLGGPGRTLILVAAAVSTLGFVSGDMLASPRLLFAFGHDGLLPARLGAVHARFRTPHVAIAIHAAACCAAALSGTFRVLAVLSVVATLLIYLACCLAVLELRRRDVRADGAPFRIPGGAAVPLLACAVVLWPLASATVTEFLAVAGVLVSPRRSTSCGGGACPSRAW